MGIQQFLIQLCIFLFVMPTSIHICELRCGDDMPTWGNLILHNNLALASKMMKDKMQHHLLNL